VWSVEIQNILWRYNTELTDASQNLQTVFSHLTHTEKSFLNLVLDCIQFHIFWLIQQIKTVFRLLCPINPKNDKCNLILVKWTRIKGRYLCAQVCLLTLTSILRLYVHMENRFFSCHIKPNSCNTIKISLIKREK